jgi:hypothetical protein
VLAVDSGGSGGATAADGRADFEAHHRQGALAMLDHNFAEEDLAESGNTEAMSDARDARAVRLHLFDASAKKSSVRLHCFQLLAGLKGILRYFAEFPFIIKVFLGGNERWQAFEDRVVQFDLDRAVGDAQVFEPAADHADGSLLFVPMMFGIQAGDDAVGGDNVHDVEPLDRRGHQRVVGVVVSLVRAGNVRVALAERDKLTKLKIVHTRIAVATDDGKRAGSLNIDGFAKWTGETAVEGMSTGMVVERAEGLGAHLVTLPN